MTTGRKPKPTKLKLLHGNPGRRPIPEGEPRPDGKLPEPPEHLTPSARVAWAALSKELERCGLATNIDAIAFELLCSAYGSYLENCAKVAEFGAVWVEKGEKKIPKFAYSPYWAVMNREWKKVHQMLVEFGMTPSSRSRVVASSPEEENPLVELARIS